MDVHDARLGGAGKYSTGEARGDVFVLERPNPGTHEHAGAVFCRSRRRSWDGLECVDESMISGDIAKIELVHDGVWLDELVSLAEVSLDRPTGY